jgi:hypothetical protein
MRIAMAGSLSEISRMNMLAHAIATGNIHLGTNG